MVEHKPKKVADTPKENPEHKRKAAQLADNDFLDLLSDKLPGNLRNMVATAKSASQDEKASIAGVWLHAKKTPGLVQDKRYDAVAGRTRREELFAIWAKGERRPKQL